MLSPEKDLKLETQIVDFTIPLCLISLSGMEKEVYKRLNCLGINPSINQSCDGLKVNSELGKGEATSLIKYFQSLVKDSDLGFYIYLNGSDQNDLRLNLRKRFYEAKIFSSIPIPVLAENLNKRCLDHHLKIKELDGNIFIYGIEELSTSEKFKALRALREVSDLYQIKRVF